MEWTQNPSELETGNRPRALKSNGSETRLGGRGSDYAVYVGQEFGESREPPAASTAFGLLRSYHSKVVNKSATDGFLDG
jgi:hypothetical protein